MTELSKFIVKSKLWWRSLPQLLDAILANVEMTMVTSVPNISKTAGDHGDHSSRFKVKTFVLTFLQKLRKSNHGTDLNHDTDLNHHVATT